MNQCYRNTYAPALIAILSMMSFALIGCNSLTCRYRQADAVRAYQRAQYQHALSLLNRNAEIKPDAAEVFQLRGWTAFQLGDYPSAQADFQRSLELAHERAADDSRNQALIGIAWARFRALDYQGTIDAVERVTITTMPWSDRDRLLGWSLLYLDRAPDAEAHFRNLLNEYQLDLDALNGLARAYYVMQQYDKARTALIKRIQWLDNDAAAVDWNLKGWIEYNAGVYGAAREAFDKAHRLGQHDVESLLGLGWTAIELNEPAQAESYFKEVLTTLPDNESALAGLKALEGDKAK